MFAIAGGAGSHAFAKSLIVADPNSTRFDGDSAYWIQIHASFSSHGISARNSVEQMNLSSGLQRSLFTSSVSELDSIAAGAGHVAFEAFTENDSARTARFVTTLFHLGEADPAAKVINQTELQIDSRGDDCGDSSGLKDVSSQGILVAISHKPCPRGRTLNHDYLFPFDGGTPRDLGRSNEGFFVLLRAGRLITDGRDNTLTIRNLSTSAITKPLKSPYIDDIQALDDGRIGVATRDHLRGARRHQRFTVFQGDSATLTARARVPKTDSSSFRFCDTGFMEVRGKAITHKRNIVTENYDSPERGPLTLIRHAADGSVVNTAAGPTNGRYVGFRCDSGGVTLLMQSPKRVYAVRVAV